MKAEAGAEVPAGPLAGLRVFDLSKRFGHYCGKLMADMGAEVILVEPPRTGTALREQPPFLFGRDADRESGIPFVYLNTSKRGITLDLHSDKGARLLTELVAGADLVLEDGAPGELAAMGLGYEKLSARNPRLSMTSITPFGQTGPYAAHAADDLTLLAQGGLLHMMGYADLPPTQAAGNQAYAMGSMFAAVGSMLALYEAQTSGIGQQVDVSIQECVVLALENAAQLFDLEHKVRQRQGIEQRYAGSGVFPCADGHVYVFAGGMAAARFWRNLVDWLVGEGVPGAQDLGSPQWSDMAYVNSDAAKEAFARIFGGFAQQRTMADLYLAAQS
ncbi:MAG: CoA-transferase family protein 7, partial [Ramlibacter sp.]|nr:CoA-transferase family protein 7 [Ramlibacter sp.]